MHLLLRVENIQERYGTLTGQLHMIELEKGHSGLGLSLAGNKDRTRMSVFIVGIDPTGAAGRDGRLQIADELLEVGAGRQFQNCSWLHPYSGNISFQKVTQTLCSD